MTTYAPQLPPSKGSNPSVSARIQTPAFAGVFIFAIQYFLRSKPMLGDEQAACAAYVRKLRLQAIQQPAKRRQIPPSPPKNQSPCESQGFFFAENEYANRPNISSGINASALKAIVFCASSYLRRNVRLTASWR
jgi:hypothetical protein